MSLKLKGGELSIFKSNYVSTVREIFNRVSKKKEYLFSGLNISEFNAWRELVEAFIEEKVSRPFENYDVMLKPDSLLTHLGNLNMVTGSKAEVLAYLETQIEDIVDKAHDVYRPKFKEIKQELLKAEEYANKFTFDPLNSILLIDVPSFIYKLDEYEVLIDAPVELDIDSYETIRLVPKVAPYITLTTVKKVTLDKEFHELLDTMTVDEVNSTVIKYITNINSADNIRELEAVNAGNIKDIIVLYHYLTVSTTLTDLTIAKGNVAIADIVIGRLLKWLNGLMRKYLTAIEKLREGSYITIGKLKDKWLVDKVIFDGYLENDGSIDEVLGALQHKAVNTLSEVMTNKDRFAEDYILYINTLRLKETKHAQERLKAYVLENFDSIYTGGDDKKRGAFKNELVKDHLQSWDNIKYLTNYYICKVYDFNYLTNCFIYHADSLATDLKIKEPSKAAALASILIIDSYMADLATWVDKVNE